MRKLTALHTVVLVQTQGDGSLRSKTNRQNPPFGGLCRSYTPS